MGGLSDTWPTLSVKAGGANLRVNRAKGVLEQLGRVTVAGAGLDLQTLCLLPYLEPHAVRLEDDRAKAGRWLSPCDNARSARVG